MSVFAKYKRSSSSNNGTQSDNTTGVGDDASGKKQRSGVAGFPAASGSGQWQQTPSTGKKKTQDETKDEVLNYDNDYDRMFFSATPSGKQPAKQMPAKQPATMESDHHDYIRDNCLIDASYLRAFGDVVGAKNAKYFAENYQPISTGASRAVSGLLLFGPSGTGKSLAAEAITKHIGGTFYKFSSADLPSHGEKQAKRINALFDVAMAGDLPAVIFIDECDTVLSSRATARVGEFAKRFERFTDNLLVIGATNEPKKIAPKILTGRFERKIFMDNPSPEARKAMIERQLAEEISDHALTTHDLNFVVNKTNGRSAVNMERLISTAANIAAHAPVCLHDFEKALTQEPSDYDKETAENNAAYDKKHGWHFV